MAQLRAALALRRLVARVKPDVVHLHSTFAGFVGGLAVPRRIPCVYTPARLLVLADQRGSAGA